MLKVTNIEQTRLWKILDMAQKVILITANMSAALVVAIGVFTRYVLKIDFFGQEEIVTVIAMWLYFIGGVRGSFEDSHIQADVVSTLVKDPKIKKGIAVFVKAVSVAVLVVLSKWSIDYAMWSFESHALSTGLKIPLILSQGALMVGFIFMAIYTIYHLLVEITKKTEIINKIGMKGETI